MIIKAPDTRPALPHFIEIIHNKNPQARLSLLKPSNLVHVASRSKKQPSYFIQIYITQSNLLDTRKSISKTDPPPQIQLWVYKVPKAVHLVTGMK